MYNATEILTTVLLIAAVYYLSLILRWTVHRYRRLKLFKQYGIPGPEPSFFSGNLRELKSEPTPNGIITNWLKMYGDVFGYYHGEWPYVVVKDLDMLKQIMIKDFHLFCDRPEMPLDVWPLKKTIMFLRGQRWKEIRSLLTPTFSSGKIKLLKNIIAMKIDVTSDKISKHAERKEMFDIYGLVQALTLDVIAHCAFAMKTRCQEDPQDMFLTAVRDFIRYSYNRAVEYAIMFPIVASTLSIINNFMKGGRMTIMTVESIKEAIEARKRNSDVKNIDLLQMMLDHSENEPTGNKSPMTDDEIIANAYVFLLAGYETTSTALAFTFYFLVKYPEIQQRLQEEIDRTNDDDYATIQGLEYLDQVFKESLRYYPPITGFISRNCEQDYKVGSFIIPKGTNVLAPIWDIHHDPKLWPDPWKFDPDRFSAENKVNIHNLSYFPFGIGPRNCIGIRFAQLEAKLTLFRLLKKFTFEACEKTDDPLPIVCPTVITHPKNGVYVCAHLRNKK